MPIESERLILRPWKNADRQPFADISADEGVIEHLLPLTAHDAYHTWIDRQIENQQKHRMCFWAVEAKQDGAFVGAVGLLPVTYRAHFTPAVEVGWRVARPFWGLGYAPEAAAAAIRFGFESLQLPKIVCNAGSANEKSMRVMSKLGMLRDLNGDFDHPLVPEGNPLRRQVLYRLTRSRWLAQSAAASL
ncbi:GNAT family N-acetyltransferase [Caballeronia sp. LZ001]|uniref:GNAT family N-acetyltransferase n=1 Tax=Caballeronia sp. LZ001 TaxID=3038553 RepID=UPI002862AF3F|nr:GNAT family N-acetyltransferase [Caballeronia sp. LZ001]MDR5806663.1 GNAT family N-acetyltransferase [Caballeronia sp. LZ001]